MFNKNDPLIGAVTGVMKENELRRRVEANLCEELGIYSRKVLPREHQSNYDALLEQRLSEALHPNQQKLDVHEPEKDKLTKHDFKMLRSGKKSKEMDEAELAGPETGPRKTSGSNQTVAEEQLDELKGIKKDREAAKEYIKKASHDVATKSAATGRYAERSNKEESDRKKTGDYSGYRQGRKDNETADKMFKKSWSRRKYMAKAVDKLEEQEQDSRNPLPPSGAKERIQNKLIGTKSSVDPSYKHQGATASDREEMNKKMEKLDEVSKAKVARYATKAVDDVSHDSFIAGGASQSAKSRGTALEFDKKAMKRQKGVNLAIKKLSGSAKVNANEDVQLDEAAKSKAQQRIMGMALAMRRGESDRGSDKVKKIATDMSDEEMRKFAKTKRKGLPDRVKKEEVSFDDVMEEIRANLGEARMKKIEELTQALQAGIDRDESSMAAATAGRPTKNPKSEPVAAFVQGAAQGITGNKTVDVGDAGDRGALGVTNRLTQQKERGARAGMTPADRADQEDGANMRAAAARKEGEATAKATNDRAAELEKSNPTATSVGRGVGTVAGIAAGGVAGGAAAGATATGAKVAAQNFGANVIKGATGSTTNVTRNLTGSGRFASPGVASIAGRFVGANPVKTGAAATIAGAAVGASQSSNPTSTPAAASTAAPRPAAPVAALGDTGNKTMGSYSPVKATGFASDKPAATSAAKQTFGQAFAAARKEAGGQGGSFQYGGKTFQTNVKGEKYQAASKLKPAGMNESLANTIRKVLKG